MKNRSTPQVAASPVETTDQAVDQAADRRTRDRVAQLLLEQGQATAPELAERLHLTVAGVRRHLDAMLADGTLVAREARQYGKRMRGRPAKVFSLSAAGHAAGPSAYDEMAVDAIRFLAETAGDAAVEEFARKRMASWEASYADRIGVLPVQERPAALAAALTSDGYAATVADGGCGVQLCQHHCPVQQVAAEFPVLCEVETEAIGRLTGRHVQRLATISRGDEMCTTHIPLHSATVSKTSANTTSGRTSR